MNSNVIVGTTTTRIVDINTRRRLLILGNNSNEDMYISLGGTAAITSGIPCKANGGVITLEKTRYGDYVFTGEVNGICATGGKVLSVCELDHDTNYNQ